MAPGGMRGGGAQALILLQKLTSHKLQLVYIGRILTVGRSRDIEVRVFDFHP